MPAANDASLDAIFRNARTHTAWQEKKVEESLLRRIHDVCRFGPTSANYCPMRIVFVKSKQAKDRLKPCLDAGNVEKTMKAPVTAIIAYDLKFYDSLPKLYPQADAKSWFEGKEEKIKETAFRNGSLQGAYFLLAARALGLDCGPMSGFNNAKLDAEFFANTSVKSNFLCNLGYGDASKLHPRNPRFDFEEACKVV